MAYNLAMFEGPDRNRNIVIAAVVVVITAVLFYLYAAGYF
jgi:hypothetical protein